MHPQIFKNAVFVNNAEEHFRVVTCSDTSVFCEPEGHSGSPLAFTISDFVNELKEEKLARVSDLPANIENLDAYQQKHFERRAPYLHSLLWLVGEGHQPTSDETYKLLKKKVEVDYGTCRHPGKSTIGKWWKAFKDAGNDIKKALPRPPSVPKRLDKASNDVVEHFATETWLKANSPNIARGYEAYKLFAQEAYMKQSNDIKIASESTFRRRIKVNKEIDRVAKAGNHNQYQKAIRTLLRKIKTSRPLERVELDRASFNLSLLDDDTLQPTGCVSIYAAIDCFTRLPIGLTVEFGTAEDTRGVAKLIKSIFIPNKEYVNAYGKPEKLIADNGPGFSSSTTHQLTEDLKIEYIRTPTGQPWKKPFVESFFNTLRKEFFEGLVSKDQNGQIHIGVLGYLGKRTDTDSLKPEIENVKKAAQITISEFMLALNDYLHTFVTSPHSQLNGLAPITVWNNAESTHPSINIGYENVKHHFRTEETVRTLNERGNISLDYQTYSSTELKAVYNDLRLVGDKKSPDVIVKRDLDDAREITVIYRLPGDSCYRPIIVPHQDIGDSDTAISFEELNRARVETKRRSPDIAHFTRRPQKTARRTSTLKTGDLKEAFGKYGDVQSVIEANNKREPLKSKTKAPETKASSAVKSKSYNLKGQQLELDEYYDDTEWNEPESDD
ncbi:hypothetical protein [Thalassotalea aquiviva]|uniref:hypothetical protein n=1 Tax=Thalassotalea aquiviva TaxID=3242415 RepID=UPI00352A6C17